MDWTTTKLTDLEATVVIARGGDAFVESTANGHTAPAWARALACAELASWSRPELYTSRDFALEWAAAVQAREHDEPCANAQLVA